MMMKSTSVFGRATLVAACGWVLLAAGGAVAQEQIPEEARRHVQEALGPPFAVFRGKVQEELKLDEKQKEKLESQCMEVVQDAMMFFEKLDGAKGEEREQKLGPYRRDAQERLAAFLKETLKAEQLKRLRQLELQQEGAIALLQPDVGKELKITDDQRKQFFAVVQDLHKKVKPLIKEAESGGNPEEIRPKVMTMRKEHEGKIAAMLTADQKKQWKEMLGKPFPLDD
jgi:hypothetical protein